MKTCPNPKCKATGIPDDAQFCPKCGRQIYKEQEVQESPSPFERITKIGIYEFECEYCSDNGSNISGTFSIDAYGVSFDTTSLLSDILKGSIHIRVNFSELTRLGLKDNSMLLIASGNGSIYSFIDRNRQFAYIKYYAYLIELYRRLYYYYCEYKEEPSLQVYCKIGGFIDSCIDFEENVSDEELVQVFENMHVHPISKKGNDHLIKLAKKMGIGLIAGLIASAFLYFFCHSSILWCVIVCVAACIMGIFED